MKWIKSRKSFIKEVKIGDLILPRQATQVRSVWGEKWLNMEEVDATDKIIQGTWKLSDEDKNRALGTFFNSNLTEVFETFKKLPDKFIEIITKSIKDDLLPEESRIKFNNSLANFDLRTPSVDEIYLLYENIFRKLAVGETKATEVIQRDDSGKPIMGEDGRPLKIKKEVGEPIFTKNLVNINGFVDDYNNCYPENRVNYDFTRGSVFNIRNAAGEDLSKGAYKIDFDLFKKDLYLSIVHNPKDILNMSISRFYASCQHLYTGGYRSMVLPNVFDPNSVPAFLKFDTPIYWKDEKISDQVPLCRMMVRNLEGFNDDVKRIFFDRSYPDRMKDIMDELIIKYSKNEKTVTSESGKYLFTPDVKDDEELQFPYMDKLGEKRGKYIGKNAESLCISTGQNWSNILISPKAQIKELTIETTEIPANVLTLPFNLDWVKFKYLKINDISKFKFKSKSFGFEKCKFDDSVLRQVKIENPELTKLQLIGCDIDDIDLSIFDKLESLELVYCLEEGVKLEDALKGLKIKDLVISGDIVSNSENKNYINLLRKSGVKVQIKGLVI